MKASGMFERYSFVAITTSDLDRARWFRVDAPGFTVTSEKTENFFMIDAGGPRPCVDLAEGAHHKSAGGDPVIGLKVSPVRGTLAEPQKRGVGAKPGPMREREAEYGESKDPDGHAIIVTERD